METSIFFGFLWKYTCSCWDLLKLGIAVLKVKITQTTERETKSSLAKEQCAKEVEQKLYSVRNGKFYPIKRKCHKESRKHEEIEAITVGLTYVIFISFNINVLSGSTPVFYFYNENVTGKGGNDLCLMMKHFYQNILSSILKHIIIFCDL